MKRIIVNADDCGMSVRVNEHIEQAILAEKITSTTIMANMDDFDGAVNLYKKYNERISFGWHINLSEGAPLLYSQMLLDKGFYKETEKGIVMDGKKFIRKWLPADIRDEILKELKAQYEKLRDHGIELSHIDSHHHVHTSNWAITLIPKLLKGINISAMRNISNNVPFGFSSILRHGWSAMMKYQVSNLTIPDVLSGYQRYIEKGLLAKGEVIELECHPGHPSYEEEEQILLSHSYENTIQLINYKDLQYNLNKAIDE